MVKSLSPLDLPRPADNRGDDGKGKGGLLPDKEFTFATILADEWFAQNREDGDKPRAIQDLPFRASMSGECPRKIWYYCNDEEVTNESTTADIWRMGLGTHVHEIFQGVLESVFANRPETFTTEGLVDLREVGISGSGHYDILVEHPDGSKSLVELKTINGYGFKLASSSFRGPAEGPRHSHYLQAGLMAAALGADRFHIVYLSMELMSPSMVAWRGLDSEYARFLAEWSFDTAEELDALQSEASRISDAVGSESAPPAIIGHLPEYPPGATVIGWNEKDAKGLWVKTEGEVIEQSGTYYGCGYCSYKDKCMEDMA